MYRNLSHREIPRTSAESAYGRICDGMTNRARFPFGEHVNRAILRASEVMAAPRTEKAQKMDDLLAFLLDEFPGRAERYEVARVTTERTFASEPVSESVVPIMIMAELLNGQRMRLDLMKCPNWPPFVERYGEAMMMA